MWLVLCNSLDFCFAHPHVHVHLQDELLYCRWSLICSYSIIIGTTHLNLFSTLLFYYIPAEPLFSQKMMNVVNIPAKYYYVSIVVVALNLNKYRSILGMTVQFWLRWWSRSTTGGLEGDRADVLVISLRHAPDSTAEAWEVSPWQEAARRQVSEAVIGGGSCKSELFTNQRRRDASLPPRHRSTIFTTV